MFDHNATYIKDEIYRITEALKLPDDIAKTAFSLYCGLRTTRYYNPSLKSLLDADAAALVYIACRLNHICVRYWNIVGVCKVDMKKVTKRLRYLMRKIKVDYRCGVFNFVLKYANELELPEEATQLAVKLAKKVEECKIHGGKDPSSVATAIIYLTSLMCGIKITQRDLAIKTGVTETTIRKRYKEILLKCFGISPDIFNNPEEFDKLKKIKEML